LQAVTDIHLRAIGSVVAVVAQVVQDRQLLHQPEAMVVQVYHIQYPEHLFGMQEAVVALDEMVYNKDGEVLVVVDQHQAKD
jgi:hypothetical protein